MACAICLEDVFIPVEITGFPCDTRYRGCYSFQRVCERCAIRYLHLDKDKADRPCRIRCIFCESTLDPREAVGPLYRKDFLLMSLDTKERACPSCPEVRGTHLEIDAHLERDCPRAVVSCPCGAEVERGVMEAHQRACCLYRVCPVCDAVVLSRDRDAHLREAHGSVLCLLCNKITGRTLSEHMETECCFRLISCRHCSSRLPAHGLIDHLIEHVTASKDRLRLLEDIQKKENRIYESLLREAREVFESVYGVLEE